MDNACSSPLFLNASPIVGFPTLAQLPWHQDPDGARRAAVGILTGETRLRLDLIAWLRTLKPAEISMIVDRSLELSSHYKWLLGGTAQSYLVWLHQYKQPQEFAKASTFAASIHDHRLWFASRVITGGLDVTWYEARIAGRKAQLSAIETRRLGVDTVIQMTADEIHGINSVEEGTFTLLIQGPAERGFSTAFNISDGTMRRNYDLATLYADLDASLLSPT
jgi:hypothetical protein